MPRERSKERACDKAIINTLHYGAIFKYPLSFFQLSTYLISKRNFDYNFFRKELKKLVKNDYIEVKKDKFYSKNVKPVSWEQRTKTSQNLLGTNKIAFEILKKIPWIKLLAVTGSVAAYNADKESDIDVLVVTEKNRLWITRFFAVLLLKAIDKYPKTDGESNRICANIFMDEETLTWKKEKQNIYIAHEIAFMQPIINKDETYFHFMRANEWVFDYFSNFKVNLAKKARAETKRSRLVNWVEKIVMKLQLKHMQKKKTTEETTRHFIHFNKFDSTQEILKAYYNAQISH